MLPVFQWIGYIIQRSRTLLLERRAVRIMFYYLGGDIGTPAHGHSLEARKCALLNHASVTRLTGVRGSLHHLNILPN